MNLKEKVALVYARKQKLSARTNWRTTVIFLALLIPALAGQLAAAEDQPGAESAVVIEVYSGAVAPDATQEKGFWLWLESLEKREEPHAGGVPKVIHIEQLLQGKDFDVAEQADANGQKIVVQAHVSPQGEGKVKIAFSELGRPPAYSGATELTLGPGERRVLRSGKPRGAWRPCGRDSCDDGISRPRPSGKPCGASRPCEPGCCGDRKFR